MIGSGPDVFSVWGYVIAKNRMGVVELNPTLLAFLIGATEKRMADAIDFLCRPDAKSRSQAQGGKRLVKEGVYQYRMVNWEYYDKIKSLEELRQYNREKQAEYRERERLKKKGGGTMAERLLVKALGDGDQAEADRISGV